MSHEMKLLVRNNSDYTLKTFSIVHSWDGHNEILKGENLPNGGTESPFIDIITGYLYFDWYTVQIEFDKIGVRQTNFYCNSSQNQDEVVMEIHNDFLNCMYYSKKKFMTACNHKGYSGLYQDELDAINLNKRP